MLSADVFHSSLKMFRALWPHEEWTEARIAVYLMALADIHDDVYLAAVERIIKQATYLPKPHEIRAAAEAVLEAHGQLPASPEAAWSLVLHRGRTWYDGQPVRVGNPLIDEALRSIGGLRAVAMAESERQLAFLRRDFLQLYTAKRAAEIELSGGLAQPLPAGHAPAPALTGGDA